MHEGACATLAIACAVACGLAIVVMTSQEIIGGKVCANIIVYVAYCLLLGAYTILIVGNDDDDEEAAQFV